MTRPPLTIIHIANFPSGIRKTPRHTVEIALSNGLIRNGHLVINISDRALGKARVRFGPLSWRRRSIKRPLIDLCAYHRPDVVLLGHADLVDVEVLEALRHNSPSVKIAQWNVDPVWHVDNVARIRKKIPFVDLTFVTTAGRPLQEAAAGAPALYLPNPLDPSIMTARNFEKSELPCDVFFACTAKRRQRRVCGTDVLMDDFFSDLRAALPQVKFYLPGINRAPTLVGAAYHQALCQAAIGLNISERSDLELYSSDRMVQYIGSGMALLTEAGAGFQRFFSDDELGFYSSIDEMTALISELTGNSSRRQELGRRGFARYSELFNCQRIAAYVIDALYGDSLSNYPWA